MYFKFGQYIHSSFKAVQRKTMDIEKNAFREARANNYKISKPPGSNSSSHSNKSSIFEDNFVNNRGPTQTHVQEEIDLQALEEQERTIRDLEVSSRKNILPKFILFYFLSSNIGKHCWC